MANGTSDRILVVEGDHVVGSCPRFPGKALLAYGKNGAKIWLSVTVLGHYDSATGEIAYATIVRQPAGVRPLYDSTEIPAPFDRFRLGGEALPLAPAVD